MGARRTLIGGETLGGREEQTRQQDTGEAGAINHTGGKKGQRQKVNIKQNTRGQPIQNKQETEHTKNTTITPVCTHPCK